MGIAYMYIFGHLTIVAFEYFFNRAQLVDPGSLIGIGLGGCIGVIGFVLRHWDAATVVAVCVLVGCIGSGIYRFNEDPRDRQNRYRAIDRGNERVAIW